MNLHYELMGRPVQVRIREEKVARFIASYKAIRDDDVHVQVQEDRIKEWWTCNGQQ
jgi:hypothetical protein